MPSVAKGSIRKENRVLSNLSVNYTNNEFIASKFMKDIFVVKDTDRYIVYNPDFKLPDDERHNGSPANMIEWSASYSTYSVFEHALKDVITDTDYDNADEAFNLDADTTEFLTDQILLKHEYKAQQLLFTSGTFSNNVSLNTASSWNYNATTTSAPIQNVLSGTTKIIQSSGKRPNTLVIGRDVFNVLKENNNVYNRIQYVERAIITEDLLSAVFDIDNVYVGDAIYNTNKEGETASLTAIWSEHALLAYFDPNPGRKKVTAAATFRVRKKGTPNRVKKWRDEDIEGNYIEVQTKYQHQAIATSCAYLFKSCTAT